MTDNPFVGPFGEFHFRDQLWFCPNRFSQTSIFWLRRKRHRRLRDLVKHFLELQTLLNAEASPDPPRIDQFSFFFPSTVNTQHQRSETREGLVRRSVANHHKLLTLIALHLQPTPGPRGLVNRIRQLGNNSFDTVFASLLKKLLAIAFDVIAVSNSSVSRQ